MLKVLRHGARPYRLDGPCGGACYAATRNITFGSRASTTGCLRFSRCSSLLLRVAAQHSVRWNSSGSSSKDNTAENSSRQKEVNSNNHDDADNVVYPCFSDLDNLHFISKERLSRAGLERMTEIQFKTWGPVLEGRGTWCICVYDSSLCNHAIPSLLYTN